LPVPIAIVQHMPPLFTASLAQRLDKHSKAVRCREAREGDVLRASVAYIAPGGHHLSVTRDLVGRFVAHLTDGAPENSCRPAADVLFRSAAATGASLLGVVMTGMGQDGLRGCEAIHERQGQIVVQDEATSVVWGMPGAVARADLAHAVLPLPQIAGEITRRVLFTAAKSA
jgi:two-component system chemotaxis response regulator CheB